MEIETPLWEGADVANPEAFIEWLKYSSETLTEDNFDELHEKFEDEFAGQFFSVREFGEELADQFCILTNVDESIAYYFDYESWGRDLIIGGDYWESNTYYFRAY